MNWKPVPGFDGKYDVSDTGCVRTLHRQRVRAKELKSFISPSQPDYLQVALCTGKRGKYKYFSVHTLVAKVFCERPEGCDWAHHKNGNTFDNRAENLEWVTPKMNRYYSLLEEGIQDESGDAVSASY